MATTISPQELAARHERGEPSELIDVRMPVEFQEVHVTFARNVPLDRLDPNALMSTRADASESPLYLICRSGARSNQARERLAAAGFHNVFDVAGGTVAWEKAGLPVLRGKKSISLERQVRITVGLLVLIGSVLTKVSHPYWLGLPAFMGAGLIFSGISDFCGLALILGRMPWNQVSQSSPTGPNSSSSGCSVSANPH